MTDLLLAWDNDSWSADLLLADGALSTDDGMRTAILISLFTDARAPAGAELPERGADQGGWWGNDFPADDTRGGELGSTLWLLRRAKVTRAVIEQARQAALSALAWLIEDGVVSALDVEAEAQAEGGTLQRLALGIWLERPAGPARQRFDFVWNASTGVLS